MTPLLRNSLWLNDVNVELNDAGRYLAITSDGLRGYGARPQRAIADCASTATEEYIKIWSDRLKEMQNVRQT